MDSFIAAARKRTSKFSAAVLSTNIVLSSLFAGVAPFAVPTALAATPTCTTTLNGGDNIQTAITAATAGDVICLNPGTYTPASAISVTKSLTIIRTGCDPDLVTTRSAGNPAVEAIVDGNNASNIFSIPAGVNDVTIACLEITDGSGDLVTSADSGAVHTGIVIKNNIVHDSRSPGDEGIQLKRTNGAVIQYNDIYDVTGDGINLSGAGTTGGQILDNRVHDVDSNDGAIYHYDASNATISGNLIYDVSSNDAIKLGNKSGADAGNSGGSITDNVIVTGSQDAISVYTSDTIVSGNKVKNSTSTNGAIYVTFATDNVVITNNWIDGNSTYGVRVGKAPYEPTNVTVNDNCIQGNTNGLIFNPGANPDLNAEDNWWGDVSGPSGSGPGTGDSVSANVDFNPFNAIGCDLDPIVDNNPADGIPDGEDDPLFDTDGDGVPDAADNCPFTANAGQEDTFGGPEGDACEIPADTTAPNVPAHLSPADNSILTTTAIGMIDWTDETDPSSPVTYIYQSATNPATNPDGSFVTPAYTSGPLAVSEINAAGTPEGTYYWHVRSVDNEGNASDWSTYWTINVDNTPRLIVNVTVVSDDGGTKVSGDVIPRIDGNVVTDGASNAVTIGAHTVSGSTLDGYDQVINGDCAADGSVTLASGELKTCSITYDDIPPTLTLIKQVTNDNGGVKVVADFPLFINGNPVTSGNPVTLSGGSFTASETSDPQYQPSDWTGDCATDGTITLAVGENKTCTVTNDDISAQITVNVTVTNDNGGTLTGSSVIPTIDASAVVDGAANPVLVGAHTISANALAGYTMVIGGDCASDGSITVDLADVKACSITYDDIQPLLTVTKVVVNDDGGTMVDTDFPLFVDATSVTTGVQNGFNAGNYTVSEAGNAGYAATFSGDCSSSGAITLGVGEVKSCTITNNDIAPKLTVTKIVTNDNGGTSNSGSFVLRLDGNVITNNVQFTTTAGTHVVSEDPDSQYEGSFIVGDCDGSGSITLALADVKHCYITNDDIPAHVIVTTVMDNGNGGTKVASDFTVNFSGNNPDQTSFAGSDLGVDVTLDAGSYDVTQLADSQYATSYSADCAGSVMPGETKYCTITNDDIQPLLTVVMLIINNNVGSAGPADFNPTIDGSVVLDSVATGVNAGVRTVGAFANPGITGYLGSISGDCDADGHITLLPGDVKSCVFTFDDIVPDGLSEEQQESIEEAGNGVSRGSGTSKLQAAANFVTGNLFGSIAPGAFGGGPNVPFSTAEVDVICAMQDALPSNATNGLIEWLAEYLASIMDRDAGQVLAALKDPSLCPEPVQEAVLPAAPVAFKVNAAGYPVSSNPTWNKCIAGKASLLDIRNNPDKDNHGLARDCSDYHTSNVWYHPDLHLFFTFDKKNKVTTVPQGYLVQKEQAVSLSK